MASVNKVILVGNLGADPEVRYTQNNTAVASFRIATTDVWTDRDGNKQERTEWHRIVAWARLGEICGQYLKKGKQVYIEGRLQTRQWEDKDGGKRYTTEIVADKMQMLGRPGEGDVGGEGGGGGRRAGVGAGAGGGGGRGGSGGSGGGAGGPGGGGGAGAGAGTGGAGGPAGGPFDDEGYPAAPIPGQEDDDLPF